VVVPANASGQPTQAISVDPVDGLISVVIPYASIDNAGKEDPTPGSVTLPFSNLNLSGNVFNDANGLNGPGNVDGTGIGTASGSQLYANLLDATGTTVIATVAVNTDGTYNFYGVTPNTNYVVQLSINQGIVGQPAPVKALPAGWVNTGEDCCDNAGSDGTVNGLVPVSVLAVNVINANLGIDRVPDGTNITAIPQLNPGGVIQVPVPPLVGSDPEDGTLGSGATVRIDVLPTNATLYYNGVPVVAGVPITNYNPALLTIDPNPNDASQPALLATFQYSFADAAGVFDPIPNTVNMQFLAPVAITGTVYNDVNGSANNTHQTIQDGSETGTDAAGRLYAYLVDNAVGSPTNGQIIRKVPVNADGTWSFDILTVSGTVRVMITSDNSQIIGSSTLPSLTLPAGWSNTSPLDTTIVYSNPPGFLMTNVNFGIEEIPETFSSTQPAQGNPGGTTSVAVSPSAFYAEDVEIGTVTSIRITAFPTNATSITINGTTYTSGTWPGAGVTIPTDGSGRPTVPVTIDPFGGDVTVSIPYVSIDNAGREDPSPATIILPFFTPLPINSIMLSGNYNGSNIALTWKVIGENSVARYEVERSNNAADFSPLGNVNSRGNGDNNYGFADLLNNFSGSNVYYRIKIVDADGRVKYSNLLRMSLSGIKKLIVLPNPFNDVLNIQVTSVENTNAVIRLIAGNGQEVARVNHSFVTGLNSVQLTGLERLPAGNYVMEVSLKDEYIRRKVVKQ
jgi:hypothetical protein